MSQATASTPQLDHALYYASLGWSVVPSHRVITNPDGTTQCTCREGIRCASKGKHPAINWTEYQTSAATPDRLRQWFGPGGYYSSYGVGIITGAVSGIFVVDVDEGPGKAGGDTINDVQMLYGDLPHTVQARTGGGGRHLIFRHPGGYIATAKNVLGPGVDIRGDGGFIVAAPSLHESGRHYLWDESAHPRTTAIATAPQWVAEVAATPQMSGPGQRAPSTGSGEIIRDAWGKVIDGRERHMVGIICGAIASHLRDHGSLPTPEQVMADAWPSYERTTRARGESLEADGRGQTLMAHRIGHMLRRAASGKWKVEARQPTVPFADEVAYDPETGEILDGRQPPDKPDKPKRPAILSLADLDALPPPTWLIDGIIPEGGLVVPYGPPKAGKTFLVLSAAMHIAAGKPWFGREVKQGGVVYIAGEGVGGLSMRTKAMRSHYGIGTDVPFWVVPRAVNFRSEPDVRSLADLVRATLGDTPARLVVIDTMARAMPGADENSAQDVGLVIAACDWLKDELGCTVAGIHHSGKDAERGARGTSALRGAWDAAFEIKQSGGATTLTVVDQKDAESGQILRFRMEEVAVGLSRKSLVPVLADDTQELPGQTGQAPPSGLSGIAYTALLDLASGPEGAIVPPHRDVPDGVRGVTVEAFRRFFYDRIPTRTAEARQKAFVRAVDALTQKRLIGVKEPWVWIAEKSYYAR